MVVSQDVLLCVKICFCVSACVVCQNVLCINMCRMSKSIVCQDVCQNVLLCHKCCCVSRGVVVS